MSKKTHRLLSALLFLGLLLWGTYVTLIFLGVDGHILLLVPRETAQEIARETSSTFMRGFSAFFPFVEYFLSEIKIFTGYIVASLLLYLGYVVYTILRAGKMHIDTRLSAVHIFALALGSLWLLSTTLFHATMPGMEQNLLLEPTPEVYSNVGDEALRVLRENFEDLQSGGCLKETMRRHSSGAAVYEYRSWCVQKTFFTRVLAPLLVLLLLTLNFVVLGSGAFRVLKLTPRRSFVSFVVTLLLGAAVMTMILWFLALLHILTQPAVWIALFAIPFIGYRSTLSWLRAAWHERVRYRSSFFSLSTLLLWLLVSYIALNYFTVVRPFPIGWDDLGQYVNVPRQMSVYGHIIPGMIFPQWQYVTSLGFVLFGYFSIFGSTIAMMINWMAGLFAVLAIIACARVLLGKQSGLIAGLFYYTLPMVGHFSFADMKTENALLMYGVAGLICTFLFLFGSREHPDDDDSEQGNWRWLLLAGILFGAGFASKVTLILAFLTGGVILTFGLAGTVSGIGAIFLSVAALVLSGSLSPTVISRKLGYPPLEHLDGLTEAGCVLIGLALVLGPFFVSRFSWSRPRNALRPFVMSAAIFIGGFLLYSAPWIARNVALGDELSVHAVLKAPDRIRPWVRYSPEEIKPEAPEGSRFLPPELALNRKHEQCQDTARTEELDRYWGYGDGWPHFLGLPWRNVMNLDSQGYYLTLSPLLLLLPLLLLVPQFWKRRPIRLLFYGTAMYVVIWVFIANGIPWYGIGMFAGFALLIEFLLAQAPDKPTRTLGGILFAISLMMVFILRVWQFGMQQNLYEYAWGKASAEVLGELTIPDYDDIADHVIRLSENPDRPHLYRMGTFISYFIPRNIERIALNDNQLGFFNCLNQERDHALTLKRLQALGIHSIVFDTNTATIERNPQGTLHQKVQRFADFLNDQSLGLNIVVNNPDRGIVYVILP